MTPIRSINYAIWAIWGAVTLVALLNAGWVRIVTIEGGGAFPMTLHFFFVPDCYEWGAQDPWDWRNFLEMYAVPANLVMIGIAMAAPWSRFRTVAAVLSLVTIYFTFAFSGDPRFVCVSPAYAYHNIHSYGDLSHLEGFTLLDVVSLAPRILYLALYFVTPLKWDQFGVRNSLTRGPRVDVPITT